MSSIARAVAALGYGLKGYTQGRAQYEDEQFRRDERERVKKDRADADVLKKDLSTASASTEVKPVATMTGLGDKPIVFDTPGDAAEAQAGLAGAGTVVQVAPGYSAAGKTFANMQDATKAAGDYNTDEAASRRVADAYGRAGQVEKAIGARASANQLRMSDLQLKSAQDAEKIQTAYRDFASGLAQGGWDGVPALYDRYNDGYKVRVEKDDKGGATLVRLDADGKEAGKKAYGSPLEFMQDSLLRFDPKMWIAGQQQREDKKQHQANSDRDFGLREKEASSRAELRTAQAESAMLRAAIASGKAAAGAGAAPIWDDKADAYLRERYVVADPTTGEKRVDGDGLKFAKTLAILHSRQNGGDATAAIGNAFDIDNQIRSATKGDAEAVRKARATYLQRLVNPTKADTRAPNTMTGDEYKAQVEARKKKAATMKSVTSNDDPEDLMTRALAN